VKEKEEYMDQSFRDSIGTIDESGKRHWIYPKKPKGKLYNMRTWVSILLLTLLFSGPFIRIGGQPLLLINIIERKFVMLGQVFWPQDFYIFVLIMLSIVLFVVLFTVVFGRIFCGWMCPQTIFMEMVFRKIEYWIEGDFKQQKKLNDSPWNAEKIKKKTLKTTIFLAISFLISNTFLAYIIGSDELISIITDPPSEHIAGLASIILFSGVFYFVFGWFREQVCIVACPYGRLQGVMLDRNSIVVAYDYIRGEMRGKFRKNEVRSESKKGDCIDCNQCVNVCPTGIDIRNGTQLECVNCTACIDACDHMMESVGLPKGLIRYDSEENIVSKNGKIWTPRIIAYSVVLTLILGLVSFLLLSRPQIDIAILKTPGQQYQKHANDTISNMYNYKVINKTYDSLPANIKLINVKGRIELIGKNKLSIPAEEMTEGTFFVYIDKSSLSDRKSDIEIGIYNHQGELLDSYETSFLAPVKRRKK
jgi:cytochrome c oxidase accessory protein FixG